jgi:hypothetical protein
MRITLRDRKRTTEPDDDDDDTIVRVRVLAFISNNNAQADPGGRVV